MKWSPTIRRFSAVIIFLLLSAVRAEASHIFGIDLYYTWVAGNTYTIHLVIYGDCSGSAFPSLPTSAPVINIYNGSTSVSSVTLAVQPPTTGVEVTPVCPADIDSTTCTNLTFPIPGVKKFVYSANVTLPGTSAVWRFLFQGVLGTTSAGRSNSITNIVIPGTGSTIQLVDTLNNTTFNNSNAVYTSIPTPFYCLGIPANYNPGAVDPNGDSLVFNLVPGIDAGTGTSVSYIAPYTATAPLGVTAGTFLFSSSTGQLSFTPNIIQKSLVVYNVEEFHNGVLRGTSQREMTVVVITSCSNIPPNGSITSPSAGRVTSATNISLCQSVGAFNFHINPTDPGGNNITMTVSGLPTGATFNIVGNGTHAPLGTFSWNTTGIAPGSYIFYINYLDDGCPLSGTQTIAYTVTVLPMPTQSFALVSPATCPAKAVFHDTPGGSFSPWFLQVIQGGVTIQTLTGLTGMATDSLSPGTYTLQMTNPDSCFVDTTITLASPPGPRPVITVSPPLCPGGSTGSATIAGSAGVAPYLYAIGAGAYSATGTFTGLAPGSYTLHLKDANNCIKDTTITVPDAARTKISLVVHKPFCDTFANGYVVVSGSNSIAPYTFASGTGSFGAADTFSSLGAGSYTFHVKNGNGCIVDTTVTLTDSTTIRATLTVLPILCHGNNGLVTINGIGGFGPPYSYAYNTNPFVPTDAFSLPAGTYTLHLKDANSCYFDTSVTLTQPTAIGVTTTLTNVLCNGAATGSVAIASAGGTPGYLYSLSGGAYVAASTFSGMAAGTYTVSVKDANNCVQTDSVTITQPSAIVVDSVVSHMPLCNGGANGTLTLYAHGGVPGYTYALGAGAYATDSFFTGLASGTYTLAVKDANGCIKDTTVTLGQPAIIVPSAVVQKSICNPLATGSVTLSATGGTAPYRYAMGAGSYSGTSLFSGLAAGAYTFHIQDTNNCTHDTTLTIGDSVIVTAAIAITPALCYNQASGTINVTPGGGTAPYAFGIDSAIYHSGNIFSGLLAGSYLIHVMDTNGCKLDTTVTVSQPTFIVPDVSITAPTCFGYNNGSVTVAASGGTPGYTYSWDAGAYAAGTTFGSLTAGTDSVIIKDAHGCLHDTLFTITQPSKLVITGITSTNISCFNGADGTLTVTAAGASPGYHFADNSIPWQASGSFTGLTAGDQFIQVEDSHNCITDTNVNLLQPSKLVISTLDSTNPTCPGYADGSLSMTVAGGTTPYTYSDDGVTYGTTPSFNGLPAGALTFYAKDANGCMVDTVLTFNTLPPIIVDSITTQEPTCYRFTNGGLSVFASGGAQPLYYQLGTKATKTTTAIYTGLGADLYKIIITDSRNCVLDTGVIVLQPDSLLIGDSVTLNECAIEGNIGSITANVTGGTGPYSYLWNTNPPQTTPGIAELANGVYTVHVTDSNNCQDSATSAIVYNDCCTPFLPNAFTPNDDGLNDIYRFRFVGDLYIVRFSIYNRFGQEVYTLTNTADMQQGWDGKFLGVPAEMGVYYYYAKIICGNKKDHVRELKGDVTLVR